MIEMALESHLLPYVRHDLVTIEQSHSLVSKARYAWSVMKAMRTSRRPVFLIFAHSNFLPLVRILARSRNYAGSAVIFHGSELLQSPGIRGRRLLRRRDVRVIAVSNFLAGVLAKTCPVNVLSPGLTQSWYTALAEAASNVRSDPNEFRIVTAFRFGAWRDKGLRTLVEAVDMLADDRIRLAVCGSGVASCELIELTRRYPWCTIEANLAEGSLAERFAAADLFVLATCVRRGATVAGEGFGLVLVEAQIAGTAVVAPPYGGSADAYLAGVTGCAPVDETPTTLAHVIKNLLHDKARRMEMSADAAAWSRKRFNPTTYSNHVVETLLGNMHSTKPNSRLEV
jgi:glycosyltransferase involved in cell wall biosynthesis